MALVLLRATPASNPTLIQLEKIHQHCTLLAANRDVYSMPD